MSDTRPEAEAYQPDLPLIRVLAESECWVEATDSPAHPYVVSFYVPVRLASLIPASAPQMGAASSQHPRPFRLIE